MDRRSETLRALEPYVRRARSFSGWSFDDVSMRPLDPGPSWDYESIARDYASQARSIVDVGTGGGEALVRIVRGLNARVVATEEWVVNAPVARERLASFGAAVVRGSGLHLPFVDESFDLVLDRHEELDPAEVIRVLEPGGRIITQQVIPEQWPELTPFFPHRQVFPDHFTLYSQTFEAAGMRVRTEREEHRVAYANLGDVVYMLLVTPWTIPGFDPAKDIDALLALEDACRIADGIVLTEGHYLIEAEQAQRV